MCGIVTICNYTKNLLDYDEKFMTMVSLLAKRGPDHEGYFLTPHCLMAHRRLSIIDIENGNQPMLIHLMIKSIESLIMVKSIT